MYQIYNFGNSVSIPYKGMNIFVAKNQFMNVDKEMAEALSATPYINIVKTEHNDDYENMNFLELKKLAKDKGIELSKKTTKKELIKLLSEVR